MAASHGKNAKVFANGYELSGYLKSAGITKTADVAESSALGDSAKTYVAGMKDATFAGEGMFDGAADAVDQVLAAALGTDGSELVYLPVGDTLGTFGYGMQSTQTSYSATSPVDDVVSISVEAQSSTGGERLITHHALAARANTANGTSVDGAAATTAGGVGYLQATVIGGTPTGTIKLQDSADDSTFADIITFTDVTAARASQRVEIAGTVRRYTRATWAVSGGTVTFWAGLGRAPN